MSDKRKLIYVIIIGKDKKKSGIEKGIRGFLADTLSRHNDIGWEKTDLKEQIDDYLDKISFEEEDDRNVWTFKWNVVNDLAVKLVDKKKEIYLNSGAFFFTSDLKQFSIPKNLKKPNYEHLGGLSNGGKNYYQVSTKKYTSSNRRDDSQSEDSDNEYRGKQPSYKKQYSSNSNYRKNYSSNTNKYQGRYKGGYDPLYNLKQQLINLKVRNHELRENVPENAEEIVNENNEMKDKIQQIILQLTNTKEEIKKIQGPLLDIDKFLSTTESQ